MNVRKHLLAGAVTLALLGSIAAPAAVASPPPETGTNGNSVSVEVVITDGGKFDAFFCVPGGDATNWTGTPETVNTLGEVYPPTASEDGRAAGELVICYEDTHSYRPKFNTQIASSAFTSTTSTPISAENFHVETTFSVAQTQAGVVNGMDIGDFCFFDETWNVVTHSDRVTWTMDLYSSLEQARIVHCGRAGQGTIFSWGRIEVGLNIPAGTAPGTYTSTVTLTLMPGTP